MLSRVIFGVHTCRNVVFQQFRRNLGVSAVMCQKTAAQLDPIQQLFVNKIRDYANKSKSAGGKPFGVSAEDEQLLQDQMDKLSRQYGADSVDFTQFPTFSFQDPDLQPVGVSMESKTEKAMDSAEEGETSDKPEDKPYWEI